MPRWSAGPIDKPLGRNEGPRLEPKAVDRMPVIRWSGIRGNPVPTNTLRSGGGGFGGFLGPHLAQSNLTYQSAPKCTASSVVSE
jgi:hypothetical protein